MVQSSHALLRRFSRNQDQADLERVIQADQAALDRSDARSPFAADLQSQLADALLIRYYGGHDRADLDRAIELQEATLARAPENTPNRASDLQALAVSLQARYRDSAGPADLAPSHHDLRRGRGGPSLGIPGMVGACTNLAQALQDRYDRDHRTADLDRAIQVMEQLTAHAPA
jgi:tetratricopeptide (TPR) repeat protein